MRNVSKCSLLPTLALALSLPACVTSESTPNTRNNASDTVGGADGGGKTQAADAGAQQAAHAYALQTMIYNPDDTVTSYVVLTDTLELTGELSLDEAREFPSYAFITTVGGKLLVSSGEEPVITQFDIAKDHVWKEQASLSFANLGVESWGAGFERHWFLDEHTAYLTLEVTSRIIWDPTSFEILDIKEDTKLNRKRDGLTLDATFNRPPRDLQGPVLKAFFYHDEDWVQFGERTAIAVYDPETHEERAILDVPCPALEVMSQDEQNNTYFSPWTFGPQAALFGQGPELCIRRVKSDATLDEEWTPDLTTWTGGRPVMVFRYWGNGKAIGSVLHTDEVDGDYSAGFDEELAQQLNSHWRLWLFDLETQTARPIQGIGNTSSGFNMEIMDERAFVFVTDPEWSQTTVYEIEQDSAATARFTVNGLVNNWIRVW
jgi:hypothetical protein